MKIVEAILSFAAHAIGIICLFLWLFAENASDSLIFFAIYSEALSIWCKIELVRRNSYES